MLKLKNSTSSRSKESPDPLLIWHRSHCQGVKLTMNSAAVFLFNQHDTFWTPFYLSLKVSYYKCATFHVSHRYDCYVSLLTTSKGASVSHTLPRQLASLGCVCNWLELELVMVDTWTHSLLGTQVAGQTGAAQTHPQVAALSCTSCTPVLFNYNCEGKV